MWRGRGHRSQADRGGEAAKGAAGRWGVAGQVGPFVLAGLLALAVVGFATAVASRRVGERAAIVDARTTTLVKARGLVEPAVTDALVAGAPDAVAKVAAVVEEQVLDESLIRVKIWRRDGTIVYSDEPRLEGARYEFHEEDLAALDGGLISAEVSDLSQPENRFERSQGKLLEVYLPIRTPGGERLLFEAYYDYDAVVASGTEIWRAFAPISLGALVALELVQVPIAWSLARRLRDRQRQREGLLSTALEASDVERRRIAGDLHDGVVQDLAGVAYTLAGAARQDDIPAPTAELFERAALELQAGIKALRSLLVEIYPPNLHEAGLQAALTDLLARVSGRGVAASLDSSGLRQDLPPAATALLYRAAQEAIRNVLTHARADSVTMSVTSLNGCATLDVSDDGVGFDPVVPGAGVQSGHFGLRGLADLVADAGGTMDLRSAPGRGTRLHVEVPLR